MLFHDPVDPPEVYVANPLNALGVLKRTGHDFYNDFQPVVELYHNEIEGLANLRNLSAIFPDIYAFADACSSVSLLQVNILEDCRNDHDVMGSSPTVFLALFLFLHSKSCIIEHVPCKVLLIFLKKLYEYNFEEIFG